MKPHSANTRNGPPLAIQMIAILVCALITAQLVTLALTMVLPPTAAARWSIDEVVEALTNRNLAARLERKTMAGPPDVSGEGWLVSESSLQILASRLNLDPHDVVLAFYTQLPVGGVAVPSRNHPPLALSTGAPSQFKASLGSGRAFSLTSLLINEAHAQPASGGRSPGAGARAGRFPGGGFPAGPAAGGTFPGGQLPDAGQPGSRMPSTRLPGIEFPNDRTLGDRPSDTPERGLNIRRTTQTQPTRPALGSNPDAIANPLYTDLPPGNLAGPDNLPSPGTSPNELGRPGLKALIGDIKGAAVDILRPGNPHLPALPLYAGTHDLHQLDTLMFRNPAPAAATPGAMAKAPPLPDRRQTWRPAPLPIAVHTAPTQQNPGLIEDLNPAAVERGADFTRHVAKELQTSGRPMPIPFRRAKKSLFELASPPFIEGDFIAAARQPNGTWIAVAPRPAPFPNAWQKRVILWFSLSLLITSPLAWLFVRRIVNPLRDFARAAEQLGRDPSAMILPLSGPAEIGRAANAFNQMRNRVRSFVDDRTAMVGAISHDLRTPLTRLRFRIEDVPDAQREGLLKEVSEMEAMISQVIAFIRDASTPGPRERYDFADLVSGSVADAQLVGGDVTLERNAHIPVDVDPVGIRRLLGNLLENAIKYGGGPVRVRLTLLDGEALVDVIDSGDGIPEEEFDHAFEPFYRSEAARRSGQKGTGLGLAVCRSIARAHGGDVSFAHSRDGFLARLALPAAYEPARRKPIEAPLRKVA